MAQDKRHQLFSRKGLCGYSQGSGTFSRNKRFLPLNTCFHLEKRINVINIYVFKDSRVTSLAKSQQLSSRY